MVKLHPAARKVSAGFLPMVTVRYNKGRMAGSKVSQTGNVFATADEALQFAIAAARRVVSAHPDIMTLANA